jgi:hypothetical protein
MIIDSPQVNMSAATEITVLRTVQVLKVLIQRYSAIAFRARASINRTHERVSTLEPAAATVRVGRRTDNALLADLHDAGGQFAKQWVFASLVSFLNYGIYVLIEDDSSMRCRRVN